MKIQFSRSYYENTGKNTLLDAIAETRFELECAYAGFDNATDPDLIDSYIYEVNALLKRYRFLYHQAQERNLLPEGDPALADDSSVIPLIPVMQNGFLTE